jgi:hypothetical protein
MLFATSVGCAGQPAVAPARTSSAALPARTATAAHAPDVAPRVAAIHHRLIWQVLREHDAEVRECYAANGRPKGVASKQTAVVVFKIGPGGSVLDAFTGLDTVEICVARALKAWSFPSPGGGGTAYLAWRLPASSTLFSTGADDRERPPVRPDLEQSHILAAIEQNQPSFKACYQGGLAKNGSLQGKITVHWTIDLDGTVPYAQVEEDTMGAEDVSMCIARKVVDLRFVQWVEAPIDISFPFVFQGSSAVRDKR